MKSTNARRLAPIGQRAGLRWATSLMLMVLVGCSDDDDPGDAGAPDGGDGGAVCEYTPGTAGSAEGATCSDNTLMACTGGGVPFPIDCDALFAGELEAACVEAGDFAGCGVVDGESCFITFGFNDPVVLFCGGTDASCVFQLDGSAPACVQDVGTCDSFTEPYCDGDFLVFDCNATQPVSLDCAAADEGAACLSDRDVEVGFCAGIGPGNFCDADWDGTGDAGTALARCLPGLECVGETEGGRGTCEDRCDEGTHCLTGWVVFDEIRRKRLAGLDGALVVFRAAFDWEGVDTSACDAGLSSVDVDGEALSVAFETSDENARAVLDARTDLPTSESMTWSGTSPDAHWRYHVVMDDSWLDVEVALLGWPFGDVCPAVAADDVFFSNAAVVTLDHASGTGSIWFAPRTD